MSKSRLRIFPLVTLSVFCIPVFIGLLGTWLPAFGYLPAIGARDISFAVFLQLIHHPSLPGALQATIISGVGATTLALAITLLIVTSSYGTSIWRLLVQALSPLLAVPHAAFAIGFGFLVSPSGWLLRIVSPELTGFFIPPDWLTVRDPYGISLTLALAAKEIPFLLLMCVGILNQFDIRRTTWIGRSLGYSRQRIWTRLVFPQIFPQLRLPILAVLAYSMSVVDVALILGPTVPPTFAVLIDRWFNDPDVQMRLLGSAGASSLLLLVLIAILLFLLGERVIFRLGQERLLDGSRKGLLKGRFDLSGLTGQGTAVFLLVGSCLCLVVLFLWSFTGSWRFPDGLPGVYTVRYWAKTIPLVLAPLTTTLAVGSLATVIGTVLAVGCLENAVRSRQSKQGPGILLMWSVYLPLLIPQIAFLFGVQTTALSFGIEGTWFSMVVIHLVFVLPYIFLTLSGVYLCYDKRYSQIALAVSGSQLRSFFMVKLPMLSKPLIYSMAVGFAVSVAQYLPTLYLGAGRFMTITTETVSLAGGSDRRILAVYALCQFALPLFIYFAALMVPAWLFRHRRAMNN